MNVVPKVAQRPAPAFSLCHRQLFRRQLPIKQMLDGFDTGDPRAPRRPRRQPVTGKYPDDLVESLALLDERGGHIGHGRSTSARGAASSNSCRWYAVAHRHL